MAAHSISSLFNISPRYLRSTNLERDFNDPRALDSYVLTQHAQECLGRLSAGLRPGSAQRAWRLTGNYGSGKSSFALFLAHWFGGEAARLSRATDVNVKYERFALSTRPTYLPLLVTGAREPMGRSILAALADLLDEQYSRGTKSGLQVRVRAFAQRDRVPDDDVTSLLSEANEKLVKDRKSAGLLLVLDELGKFLEFAAHHPERQDVYLLQRLAEDACQSKAAAPLFIIGMLHQGFDAYAENLDPTAQREWEKVAGRFEELLFSQPLLQVSELIAAALKVQTNRLPPFAKQEARAGWNGALELGWMGAQPRTQSDSNLSSRLYPLHGTVLAPMVKAFTRFGQNERSLFGFLLSDEPHGLKSYAQRSIAAGAMYRLPEFYDYIRVTFGHRLALQSYRSHWPQIESMVESFATSEPLELAVVKTVGVLNLLDHPDLIANDRAIEVALSGAGGYPLATVRKALERLQKQRRVLFRRGAAGGYCLWPHTSVDLEGAYEKASRSLGAATSVARHLAAHLTAHSLVARRHYIETGNLRYFQVHYTHVDEMRAALEVQSAADGLVVVVLCESLHDIKRAEQIAVSADLKIRPDILVAIPSEPLAHQSGLVTEVLRWEWVALNTPELNADRFAREELSRQRQGAKSRLENRVQDLIGLRSLTGARALRWFARGTSVSIGDGRQLLQHLSNLCDEMYRQAPLVKNELLNRHGLSSAAASARMRLINGVLRHSRLAYLGMDNTKKPPEMSMYMSVLQRGRLHVADDDGFKLQVPRGDDDVLRFAPCLDALRTHLEERQDQRISASVLLSLLGRAPYGVRQGLAPLVLAIFTAMNSQELAFYEDGSFLREVSEDEFLRLTKSPQSFELQLCRISGLRAEVFESLLKILGLRSSVAAVEPLVLDVVRPLCAFVAGLPDYARNTRRLPPEAQRVRSTILGSKDPISLLFTDLPQACELEPFDLESEMQLDRARQFANALKATLEELRSSFESLLERMRSAVGEELSCDGSFAAVRAALSARAEVVTFVAAEPHIKALCLRFADARLEDDPWLESLGSLLASQPPARWRDSDEDNFRRELHSLAQRFRSLESIAFQKTDGMSSSDAYKIALTRSDGHEAQEVVFVDRARAKDVDALAAKIESVLGANRNVGLAALSRVTWATLEKK